jgi:hypothetical protein
MTYYQKQPKTDRRKDLNQHIVDIPDQVILMVIIKIKFIITILEILEEIKIKEDKYNLRGKGNIIKVIGIIKGINNNNFNLDQIKVKTNLTPE